MDQAPLQTGERELILERCLILYFISTTIQPCLTCRFYQTLVLWLDEPRLHDPSLFLASLPPPYDAPRLETLLKAEMVGMFSFLIDLVAWRI